MVMKKITYLLLLTMLVPVSAKASNVMTNNGFDSKYMSVPTALKSSSETESLQWGCPVADVVSAENTQDAMAKIGQACMEDVRKAATEKPGVFDVIRVSVVWPDVQISSTRDGFKLEGTIFLETLVMKGSVAQ
jgi:hypothetical protein